MDFSGIPLFNVMKSKLNFLSERQALLAQNIANADTPNYKAVDVQEPNFQAMVQAGGGPVQNLQSNLKMTITNPKHMIGGGEGLGPLKIEKRKTSFELNPDGNNVVIEEEMSKMAQNQAEYQKVLNLYSKAISMFKNAIGNPNTGS